MRELKVILMCDNCSCGLIARMTRPSLSSAAIGGDIEYIQTNAWLYFFSIYGDTATLLFPNFQDVSNFIYSGKYSFPCDADMKKGIHFDAILPEGKTESMEIIRGIAISRPINFSSVKSPDDILQILFELKREEFEFVDMGFMIKQ